MKPLRLFGVVRALLCAGIFAALPIMPALAEAPPLATSVDIGPLINQVVLPTVAAIGSVLAAWIAAKVAAYLNLQNTGQLSGILEVALQNGLAFAQSALKTRLPADGSVPIDLKNEVLATAANYALAHVPDTLKSLGVDKD